MATRFQAYREQWSNIKLARRLTVRFGFFWISYEVLSLIYYNLIMPPNTNKLSCTITNAIYLQYYTYCYLLILTGVLPICITILFGLLAYCNAKQMAHRTIPLVRRELDKQLTTMVLVQVVFNTIVIISYIIVTIYMEYTQITKKPISAAELNNISLLIGYIYYLYFTSPFYIYVCVSQRFRRQLIHVLYEIHLNRWRQHRMIVHPVIPQLRTTLPDTFCCKIIECS